MLRSVKMTKSFPHNSFFFFFTFHRDRVNTTLSPCLFLPNTISSSSLLGGSTSCDKFSFNKVVTRSRFAGVQTSCLPQLVITIGNFHNHGRLFCISTSCRPAGWPTAAAASQILSTTKMCEISFVQIFLDFLFELARQAGHDQRPTSPG